MGLPMKFSTAVAKSTSSAVMIVKASPVKGFGTARTAVYIVFRVFRNGS